MSFYNAFQGLPSQLLREYLGSDGNKKKESHTLHARAHPIQAAS